MSLNKPAPRSWSDVQMSIAAIAMSLTLMLWNVFAGPDREEAAQKAAEQQANAQVTPPSVETQVALEPAPLPIVKIIFGGSAPQTQVVVRRSGGGGGGGGGGSTRSS